MKKKIIIPREIEEISKKIIRYNTTIVLLCLVGIAIIDVIKRISYGPYNITTYNPIDFFTIIVLILLLYYGNRLFNHALLLIWPEKSKTYKKLQQYGDPQLLLEDLNRSLNNQQNSFKLPWGTITEEYIVIPTPTCIYIAPIKELLWSFMAFRVNTGRYNSWKGRRSQYLLKFCFSTTETIKDVVVNKNLAAGALDYIKKVNPNVLIGFTDELLHMCNTNFDEFKRQILTNVEALQETTSAKEIATMVDGFYR